MSSARFLILSFLAAGACACDAALGIPELAVDDHLDCSSSDGCVCEAGYADCVGDEVCETHLSTDPESCGTCGHSCFGGTCQLGRCEPYALLSGDAALDLGSTLASDGRHVYGNFVGGIRRVPVDPMATAADISDDDRQTSELAQGARALVVHDDKVFWARTTPQWCTVSTKAFSQMPVCVSSSVLAVAAAVDKSTSTLYFVTATSRFCSLPLSLEGSSRAACSPVLEQWVPTSRLELAGGFAFWIGNPALMPASSEGNVVLRAALRDPPEPPEVFACGDPKDCSPAPAGIAAFDGDLYFLSRASQVEQIVLRRRLDAPAGEPIPAEDRFDLGRLVRDFAFDPATDGLVYFGALTGIGQKSLFDPSTAPDPLFESATRAFSNVQVGDSVIFLLEATNTFSTDTGPVLVRLAKPAAAGSP